MAERIYEMLREIFGVLIGIAGGAAIWAILCSAQYGTLPTNSTDDLIALVFLLGTAMKVMGSVIGFLLAKRHPARSPGTVWATFGRKAPSGRASPILANDSPTA